MSKHKKTSVLCFLGFNRKGQIAAEFLITYGWAVLVVLGAMIAISYFGVFNPKGVSPDVCTGPPGFACIDHSVFTGSAIFVFQNGVGRDIRLHGLSIGNGCSSSFNTFIENGKKAYIQLSDCDNGDMGERLTTKLNINYSFSPDGLIKIFHNKLITTINE